MARRRRQEGVVLLSVSVSVSGEPVAIEIQTSSGVSSLDEAAVEAVRRWEFEPGVLDGKAVPSLVEVPIRFELD
jgi:protein TonB